MPGPVNAAVRTWSQENTPRQVVRLGIHTLTGRRLIHGRPWDTLASPYFVGVRVGHRVLGVTAPCRRRPFDPGPRRWEAAE